MADRKQQPAGQGARGGAAAGRRDGSGRGGASEPDLPPPPTGPRPTPRLQTTYLEQVRPALIQEFGYQNVMQAPRVDKVVINVGLGEALTNAQAIDATLADIQAITGQRPVVTRAKKSIAAFKLRAGNAIGVMVTLRGPRMYDFLDKLFNVALPRVRDFSGVSPESFDGRGNYTLGLQEQIIFPEIDYDKVDRIRGMEVAIVTTARTDDEGRRLLQLLGMPFQTEASRRAREGAPVRRRPALAGAR